LKDAGHEVAACSRSRVEQPGIFYVRSPELGPKTDPASGDSSRLVAVQSERYREKNAPFLDRHENTQLKRAISLEKALRAGVRLGGRRRPEAIYG
jgi:hypothetical protein